ncbi:MAG: hypothetical protein HQL07_17900 [Nitrospirae bacterium]|nr:hypothetical protein [Magnetococcales bacterium]HAT50554.1 hypothetical protein [Alphaproteobacteria bacterium]
MKQDQTIKDEILKIIKEFSMLKYSIAAVESDMDLSIQRIKKTGSAFSEPRRQRMNFLIMKLAKMITENRETLFHDQSHGMCRVVIQLEPHESMTITVEPNVQQEHFSS